MVAIHLGVFFDLTPSPDQLQEHFSIAVVRRIAGLPPCNQSSSLLLGDGMFRGAEDAFYLEAEAEQVLRWKWNV